MTGSAGPWPQTPADRAEGRIAFAARSAEGLRVLDPLSLCDGSLPRATSALAPLDGRLVACHYAERFLETQAA